MKKFFVLILLFSGYAYGHGKLNNKDGACTLKISEDRAIHVTAYQPSTHEGDVFCQDAPDVVETILVLDFMEEDSKKSPFAFSISHADGEKVETLAALPLQLFPKGSMLLKFMPKGVGKYHGKVVYVKDDGHETVREFDFYIGERSPNSKQPSSTQEVLKWIVSFMFVVGVMYYIYIKRASRRDSED